MDRNRKDVTDDTVVILSHPSRGAWIEIKDGGVALKSAQSHPSRGAWIEISRTRSGKTVTGESHPSRGAWIEIPMKDIIHLSAQDEESSQVDQRAGLNKPLQSRAVFFDNKRIPYQKKPCESIQFFWKKLRDTGSDVSFPVKIYENKGRGLFKFSKYTAKEDIENVLFSIIDAQ